MRRAHWILAVLALAAAAGGAWLLLTGRLGAPTAEPPGPPTVQVTYVPCVHDDLGSRPPPVTVEALERVHAHLPAPTDAGDANLAARVEDEATGQPVECALTLWRLGVAEDDTWTAGDRPVASRIAGVEPARFEGLAPGRYRLDLPGRRMDVEDPAAFEVEAGENERTVETTVPGTLRAWIRLFDEKGGEVREAERSTARLLWVDRVRVPSWARPPSRRGTAAEAVCGGGCGGSCSTSDVWFPLARSPRGFALGGFPESSAFRAPSLRLVVHPSAQTVDRGTRVSERAWVPRPVREGVRAEVVIAGDRLADTDLVAPAPSRAALLRGFATPAWVPEALREEDPSVSASCEAAALVEGDDPDAWRRIPIAIEVRLGEVVVGKGTLCCAGPDAAPVWEAVVEPVEAEDG